MQLKLIYPTKIIKKWKRNDFEIAINTYLEWNLGLPNQTAKRGTKKYSPIFFFFSLNCKTTKNGGFCTAINRTGAPFIISRRQILLIVI